MVRLLDVPDVVSPMYAWYAIAMCGWLVVLYVQVSLQNVAKTGKPGAFTGELCAPMIKDFGLEWVRCRIMPYT